jgi:serine/threonine protein kinase
MKIVDTFIGDSSSSGICEWVLAISKSKLCIAIQMSTAGEPLVQTDPSTWTDSERYIAPVPMNPANLYTKVEPAYHRFRWRKEEHHGAVFKKYRDPLKVAALMLTMNDLRYDLVAYVIEREIRTCKFLRTYPCKTIARYPGVQCKDAIKLGHDGCSVKLDTERVIELVFKQYDCELHELINKGTLIDVKYCLEFVAAGIKHMHNLKLVHCDLKPANVFVEANLSKSA